MMPKSSRNVTLCGESWQIASEMSNFSLWVRERLLMVGREVIVEEMSDRRILAILLARIQNNEKFGFESKYCTILLDLMTEL